MILHMPWIEGLLIKGQFTHSPGQTEAFQGISYWLLVQGACVAAIQAMMVFTRPAPGL